MTESRRYCHQCGSPVIAGVGAESDGSFRCNVCDAKLPDDLHDDLTVPQDTLVIESSFPVDSSAIDATRVETPAAEATTVPVELGGEMLAPPPSLERLRERFGGRFRIEGVIGAGGMGQVYKALDLTLNRPVAIKSIIPGSGVGRTWINALRAEARVIARLHHPNVVQVYEMIEFDDHPLMVMEYVDGTDLRHALRDQRLDRDAFVRLLAEACEAVGYAHARGVIHRDIKPGNVMLTADGHSKIMDFGIAGLVEPDQPGDVVDTGPAGGSLAFMAPELLDGTQRGDTRSDIYALGVTLYRGLTGRYPFTGRRGKELVERIRNQPVVPPIDSCPEIGPDLNAVCLKALSKLPGDRYESAGEMGRDLLRALAGQPVTARRYRLPQQFLGAARLYPKGLVIALLSIALIFGGIWASANLIHKVSEGAIVNEKDKGIRNIAYAISTLVPPEQIDALHTVADRAELDAAIRRIKGFNPDMADAYLLVPSGADHGFRVALAWHASGAKAALPPRGHDSWGGSDRVENKIALGFMRQALRGKVLVQHEVDAEAAAGNEWRNALLGYAPIRDRDGKPAAVMVIEIKSDTVQAAFKEIERAFRTLLTLGGMLSGALFILVVLSFATLWRHSGAGRGARG